MDVFTMVFYGIVCGVLGLAGPVLGSPVVRVAIGAVVGIAAAVIMPAVRGMIG